MSKSPTNKKLSPLHTHTVYSVLDGAATIDQYLKHCQKSGASAIGVTDHGWQIGNLELYHKTKEFNKKNGTSIVPLPGCEFYVAPDSDYVFNRKPYDYYHVTAWAINETGYRNLCRLGSLSWNKDKLPGWAKDKASSLYKPSPKDRVVSYYGGQQQKPRITFEELLTYNEGLVLGSGCLIGALNKAFLNGEFKGAERNLSKLLEVYKGRLFMEIMPHVCDHDYNRKTKKFERNECTDWSPDGDVQKSANKEVIKLARRHKLPLLMTVDSHFVSEDQKKLQDILLTQGEPDGWRFYNSYHMLNTDQAWDHWSRVMGDDQEQRLIFSEAVENNDAVAEMAKEIQINDVFRQPTPEIPIEIRSQGLSESDQRKAALIRLIEDHGRMKWDDRKYVDRLVYELKVICDNGVVNFSDYFLFLEKWNRWAAEHSILSAPGRGSGAGSLVCYLLKITHLDPFEYNLPFERFLSHARIVMRKKFPDIDWDMGNRDLLVAKLREVYGENMAQCSTLHTLKLRSAIKDACRSILGWNSNDPRVDEITKTIPPEPQGVASKDFLFGYKDNDGNIHDGLLIENPKLQEFFSKHPEIQDAVVQLLGIPRAVSRHASAFLISNAEIWRSVPTCNISGYLCTQYQATATNNMVEKAGLIKFDLLRVNTLDDISNCIRLVQQRFGYKVDEQMLEFDGEKHRITKGELRIDQLPMGDGRVLDIYKLPIEKDVFSSIARGETETVFQLNTAAMTAFTRRIVPNSVMDLSDILALDRPGPLDAKVGETFEGKDLTMAEAYIMRRQGKIPVRYIRSDLEPLLKDTQGVFVYQEQLAQAFMDLAGYTPEEADELREILGKKKKQELEKRVPELRKRLEARGWTHEQIDMFVSVTVASSQYSFNRSHSASYAVVAYQCAYLKYHFPLEWWTAVLQNAKVEDIREKGYASTLLKQGLLSLPHVNGPTDTFRLESGKVNAPLYLIDRVGDVACAEIEECRIKGGPYLSLQNFFERVDARKVNEGVMANLILCGAFDQIEPQKDGQTLLEEYYYLRKVQSLRIGQNKITAEKGGEAITEYAPKTGDELKAAVIAFKEKEREKGKQLEIPILFQSQLQTEILRARSLPIYRLNVHEMFPQIMNNLGIQYDSKRATIYDGYSHIQVFRSQKELEKIVDPSRGTKGAWVGLLKEAESFQYTDKKSHERVTALKMQIQNDGDCLECILWPDAYKSLGEPDPNRIILITGTIKESREPGKFSVSVSRLRYV